MMMLSAFVTIAVTATLGVNAFDQPAPALSATVIWSNDIHMASPSGKEKDTVVEPIDASKLMDKVSSFLQSGADVYLMLNRDNAEVPLPPSDLTSLVEQSGGAAYTIHPYTQLSALEISKDDLDIPKGEVNETRILENALHQLKMLQDVWRLSRFVKVMFTHPRTGVSIHLSDPLEVDKTTGKLVVADVTPASLDWSSSSSSSSSSSRDSDSALSAELSNNIRMIVFAPDDSQPTEGSAERKYAAVLISVPMKRSAATVVDGLGGVHELNENSDSSSWVAGEAGSDKGSDEVIHEVTEMRMNEDEPSEQSVTPERISVNKRILQINDTDDEDEDEAEVLRVTEFSAAAIMFLIPAGLVVLTGLCCVHAIDAPASFVAKPLTVNKEY